MADRIAPVGVLNVYATPTELKRRLGITDTTRDSTLWHLLHVASRIVEGHCARNFYVTSESKRFDVRDRHGVQVDDLMRDRAGSRGLGRRRRLRKDQRPQGLHLVSAGLEPALVARSAVSRTADTPASLRPMLSDWTGIRADNGPMGLPVALCVGGCIHQQLRIAADQRV